MSLLATVCLLTVLALALLTRWLSRESHRDETRKPIAPPSSLLAKLKAHLVCRRLGHEDIYTFRLARPAYCCRYCGRWRQHDVVKAYQGGYRA